MPPDAPAPAATPTPAPAPAVIATPSGEKPRGPALIAKHVAIHEKAQAEQATKELAETAPGGTPGRDPETGKFLPAGAKPKTKAKAAPVLRADAGPAGPHKPGESGATPEPATEKKPAEDAPGASGLNKARRLVNEGKLAEAMQLIGLDPSKLESPKWKAWRLNQEEAAKAITEGRQTLDRERGELQEHARRLVNDLSPFIRGKQAFDKGDFEEAFQLCFGEDLNSFQRKALQSMHAPGVAKDPVIGELRKEIQALRAERQQEREQMTQAQQNAELNQRRQSLWNGNVEALSDSGDPRMTKLATNKKFLNMVWTLQGQHYDKQTDSTLPPLEAAELALEQLEQEHSELSQVFGGASALSDENATRTRVTPAATGPSGTLARRSAKTTSLNPSEAAEAAPGKKLKGKELIDYYSRLAKSQELRSNGV